MTESQEDTVVAKFFDSPEMREAIRRIIRSRMALKGVEYRELARRLGELGVIQHESNLRSKVNNGALRISARCDGSE